MQDQNQILLIFLTLRNGKYLVILNYVSMFWACSSVD